MIATLLSAANATTGQTLLTDAQADTIILERETSKLETKAARLAELDEATVKSEGRSILPNGQTVIIREVEPPTVGALLAKTATAPEAKSAEALTPAPEQIAHLQSYTDKAHQTVMLSATVYDHTITRLGWRFETTEFIAYTNADFNLLKSTNSLETESTHFTFFMSIGDASAANKPYANEIAPDVTVFSTERSEYILVEGDPDNQAALAGIDALLAHHDATCLS